MGLALKYLISNVVIDSVKVSLSACASTPTKKREMNAKTTSKLEDVRIIAINPLISPAILQEDYPIPHDVALWIAKVREEVADIVEGRDDRLLVVVGPCSIHDYNAAIDYGM